MSRRGPYRSHSASFKLQVCSDIRSGNVSRRESQALYGLSTNLIHHWLVQYDRGELQGEEVEAARCADYEAKIAALERKVGQLTMEIDLLKKRPRLLPEGSSAISSIVRGPAVAPSEGPAR